MHSFIPAIPVVLFSYLFMWVYLMAYAPKWSNNPERGTTLLVFWLASPISFICVVGYWLCWSILKLTALVICNFWDWVEAAGRRFFLMN